MNEWFDNQKKPNTCFRRLLKERIEEANPRCELTAEDTKRISKLEGIADKLKRAKLSATNVVKRRKIRTA